MLLAIKMNGILIHVAISTNLWNITSKKRHKLAHTILFNKYEIFRKCNLKRQSRTVVAWSRNCAKQD